MHIRAARAGWGGPCGAAPGLAAASERCAVLGGGWQHWAPGSTFRGWRRSGEARRLPCAGARCGFASPSAPLRCARLLGVASPGFPRSAGSDAGLPRSRSRPLRPGRAPLYGDCQLRKRALIGRRRAGPAPPCGSVGKGRRRLASLSGSACPCKQRPRAGWFGEAAGGGVQGDPWAPEEGVAGRVRGPRGGAPGRAMVPLGYAVRDTRN